MRLKDLKTINIITFIYTQKRLHGFSNFIYFILQPFYILDSENVSRKNFICLAKNV